MQHEVARLIFCCELCIGPVVPGYMLADTIIIIAGLMWYSGPFSLYRLSQCKETMRAVWWVDLMCDRAEQWVQSPQAWVGMPSLWSHAIFIAIKGKAWLGVGVDWLKVHGLTKQMRYGINLLTLPCRSRKKSITLSCWRSSADTRASDTIRPRIYVRQVWFSWKENLFS